MQPHGREREVLKIAALLLLLLMAAPAQVKNSDAGKSANTRASQGASGGQIQVPNRSATPLFKGKQGQQKTEIHFDPATRVVTLKLLVQDPQGKFIPNIKPQNFVVYENGVRQQNARVEIEQAPVSIAMLMEFGGRVPGLNRELGSEVSTAGQQFADELDHKDKLAIWEYNNKVEKLNDFSQDKLALDAIFLELGTPEISDTNLHDAVVFALGQMKPVTGRKAIFLVSSGIDTFSKTTYEAALNSIQGSDTPIYVLSLVPVLRQVAEIHGETGPVAPVPWKAAERTLEEIAKVSGGRAYAPENTVDLSPVYDDIMENIKLRYVITYRLSNDRDLNSPRTVRVELVDRAGGGPLQVVDSSGKRIRAYVILQNSYIPRAAARQ
ncbi:MAG TPA: VWA domain-containing protein [Terriglobales bacterium]|nr:VWA domain-containing protein [Terriglobales bacterium]